MLSKKLYVMHDKCMQCNAMNCMSCMTNAYQCHGNAGQMRQQEGAEGGRRGARTGCVLSCYRGRRRRLRSSSPPPARTAPESTIMMSCGTTHHCRQAWQTENIEIAVKKADDDAEKSGLSIAADSMAAAVIDRRFFCIVNHFFSLPHACHAWHAWHFYLPSPLQK